MLILVVVVHFVIPNSPIPLQIEAKGGAEESDTLSVTCLTKFRNERTSLSGRPSHVLVGRLCHDSFACIWDCTQKRPQNREQSACSHYAYGGRCNDLHWNLPRDVVVWFFCAGFVANVLSLPFTFCVLVYLCQTDDLQSARGEQCAAGSTASDLANVANLSTAERRHRLHQVRWWVTHSVDVSESSLSTLQVFFYVVSL